MELSSAIREDYRHRLDSEKDGAEWKRRAGRWREREREREMRESVQRKEGPVDKERRAGDISNAER